MIYRRKGYAVILTAPVIAGGHIHSGRSVTERDTSGRYTVYIEIHMPGTVIIFVLAMITLPVLKSIMKAAIAKAGSQSVMLGGDFHLPDY